MFITQVRSLLVVGLASLALAGRSFGQADSAEAPQKAYAPYVPIAVGAKANLALSGGASVVSLDLAGLPQGERTINGVPFVFTAGELSAVDVSASMRGLQDPYSNNSFFTEKNLNQLGRIAIPVAGDQYAALHLIAFSAGRPDHVQRATVRIGTYGNRTNICEEAIADVPVLTSAGADNARPPIAVKLTDGRQGFLHHMRVPLANTANLTGISQMVLEFTRDMNTHILPPDPSLFGKIPVGHPSDVVILAATLEPAPVSMSYTTEEGGNVFHDTQKVQFKLSLTNRSVKPVEVRAFATSSGPGTGQELGIESKTWTVDQKLQIEPGQTAAALLDATPQKRGWYFCKVGVETAGILMQQRDTTFAVLAPDTRKAMEDSPFGVWEFWFPHSTLRAANQVDVLANLIHKGGWRWTYGGSPVARGDEANTVAIHKQMKEQYKITWNISNGYKNYQRDEGWFEQAEFDQNAPAMMRERMEYADTSFKVLHESRSSSAIVRRYSEFLGGEPYTMPAAENEKIEKQFENVKKYTDATRKADPRIKIVLINDYPSVANEYMARRFPAENFDVFGLEGAMFLRTPERQPDWMSLLGQLHQTKRMMVKHGYDKPIWTTEALYHPTQAGGLSLYEQGVISVREAMIALQLGVERMAAAGLIKDSSDDYHWSNWGSAGFCFRDPEINPKPSYAMYAWMTQVLDQAKPNGHLAVPNTALHVVDFKKPDGSHVYAVWTAKGEQAVSFKSNGKPTVYDVYGNAMPANDALLQLNASPTPIYVTGAILESVIRAVPVEQKDDAGDLLIDFETSAKLKVSDAGNTVLDKAWETPRLRGAFDTSFVTEDGATAMKVTLKPDQDDRKLLPRYVVYELTDPVVLKGQPDEFALRVKGNAGWGRIMFEVVDAKGRIFTSSGNLYPGATNSADSLGQSFVSFAGWQTIRFPVVGMYPGVDQQALRPGNYNWWPENSSEEVEAGPKNAAAKAAYEKAMEAYRLSMAEYEEAHKQWDAAATAAKAANKKPGRAPKKPAEPKFREVVYMGQSPVSYPLKLTKLLVDMRPNLLYLDQEVPVHDPSIYIDNLRVTTSPASK